MFDSLGNAPVDTDAAAGVVLGLAGAELWLGGVLMVLDETGAGVLDEVGADDVDDATDVGADDALLGGCDDSDVTGGRTDVAPLDGVPALPDPEPDWGEKTTSTK